MRTRVAFFQWYIFPLAPRGEENTHILSGVSGRRDPPARALRIQGARRLNGVHGFMTTCSSPPCERSLDSCTHLWSDA